jgi:hypothetical protein
MDKEKYNYIRSFEDFRKSESFQLYRKLRKSRLILYPLRHNFISLTKSFNNFHLRESDPKFWNNLTPHLRWNTQKRITTDILNYLSSASSIVDISRKLAREELSSSELEEYNQMINREFVQDVEFMIIKKLRNYILHYSLLDVGVFSNWNWETGKSKNTFLFPEKLLNWDNWNTREKEYLQSKGERLDVEPIINRYHNKFIETQNILFLKIIKKYESEIETVINKMEELLMKGIELRMINPLPFRKSTLRYLKYLLKKI